MNNSARLNQRALKSAKRRQQVLDASEKCFREKGFHGCSIATISREAGMSPGHIYYHFADKEAIVEALVERRQSDLTKFLDLLEKDRDEKTLAEILLDHVEEMIDKHTDPKQAQLILEIASESARNPRIAEILTQSDRLAHESVRKALAKRLETNDQDRLDQIQLRLKMIITLVAGLTLYAPLSSFFSDRSTWVDQIGDFIRHLFRDELLSDPDRPTSRLAPGASGKSSS